MNDIAIKVENLSKRYRIGAQQESYKTLRDMLSNAASAPLRWVRAGQRAAAQSERDFWALNDVSFEVKRGEVVGIIGRNGAGKSTLLKILSRITEPTSGTVDIYGRVGSLLEVGTGFHPELTGRENIYLNGAILGMKREEIARQFDAIVEFAEVEKFVDTAVKHYSSGMYLRLAFAVAAHLEPEILLVDEVLAVGDAQFQKKCLGKMGEVAKQGRTVFFVSHNMAAINALCSNILVLNKGNVIFEGNTTQGIAAYSAQNTDETRGLSWQRPIDKGERPLIFSQITADLEGVQPKHILSIEIGMISKEKHKPAFIAIDILDITGVPIMQAIPKIEGYIFSSDINHRVYITIELPPMIPGQYLATFWSGSHNTETLDEAREAIKFEIQDSPTEGRSFPHNSGNGYIVPFSSIVQGY